MNILQTRKQRQEQLFHSTCSTIKTLTENYVNLNEVLRKIVTKLLFCHDKISWKYLPSYLNTTFDYQDNIMREEKHSAILLQVCVGNGEASKTQFMFDLFH